MKNNRGLLIAAMSPHGNEASVSYAMFTRHRVSSTPMVTNNDDDGDSNSSSSSNNNNNSNNRSTSNSKPSSIYCTKAIYKSSPAVGEKQLIIRRCLE